MKINGNEIRPGNVIEHQGSIWVAVKCQAELGSAAHVGEPGAGGLRQMGIEGHQ